MGNIIIGRYDHPEAVGYAGWIEPDDRSWVAFIGLDGRAEFFLHRDPGGAVITGR